MKNKILLFIFLISIIFIPKVNAYSNADLLPELTMPTSFKFIGMDPNVQNLATGYFISSENIHTDYQKEYYYLNENWYQDKAGIVASILLPVDLSDNVVYNGNLVFCSKDNLDFNKYMKLTQIYHGDKWASSYNSANKVKKFSSNLNPIGTFSTEAEDFASCYNYSFSFTTADTTGPVLGFKFVYNNDGIGPNQNGMAFMGISLDGIGLDFGSSLGGIKDSINDVNDNLNSSTNDIKDNISNSTTEINGSISNSTTNINNSINNSTSTITNEVNNMGNQISGTINDNFNSCRVSYNIFNLKYDGFPKKLSDNELLASLNDDGSIHITGTKTFTDWSTLSFYTSRIYLEPGVTYYLNDVTLSLFYDDGSWYKNYGNATITPDKRMYFETGYWSTIITGSYDQNIYPYLGTEPFSLPYEKPGVTICTNKLDDMNNQDISSADKELPDNSQFNDYENVENQILDQVKKANLDTLEIGLDLNASSFIWDTLTSFIQTHPAVFGLFISLLSIGIIKLALGR